MAAFHSKWKYEDLRRRRPCFSDYTETGHFTLLFCTGQLKNVEIYNARAQLIKPFAWRRCCCCRGVVLHCASLLRTIFASLARANERVQAQNVRDFPQTKLGDPRFFFMYLLRTVS